MLSIGALTFDVTCEEKKKPQLVIQGNPLGLSLDVTQADLLRLAGYLTAKAAALPGRED